MKRKNLLITSIGKLDSLPTWISEDRNFDIALIYYANEIDEGVKKQLETYSDFLFFESGFKYSIIKTVLTKNPELLNYEYFWMPDDDVKLVKGGANKLFDLAKKYQLGLAQPSTKKKNTSWKLLRHKAGVTLRYCNFVEVMCPLFSSKSLTACLETFSYSKSGWGLDFLWPTLIDEKSAIIDDIVIFHSKKINLDGGVLYNKLLEEVGKTPWQELEEISTKYNLSAEPKVFLEIYDNSFIGKLKKLFA